MFSLGRLIAVPREFHRGLVEGYISDRRSYREGVFRKFPTPCCATACGAPPARLKRVIPLEVRDMIAIGVIALFLVAFGVLNFLDFGRLD